MNHVHFPAMIPRLLRVLLPLFITLSLTGAEASGGPAPVKKTSTLTLGAGCFWCAEAVYERVIGVTDVESGYAGGKTDRPDYRAVCSGDTGHAEVIRITYDPSVVSQGDLLEIFWDIHDPTTLDRQGADVGSQYRSAIFYTDEAQRLAAEKSRAAAAAKFPVPIVTTLEPLGKFHPAEDYHQDYFRKHPDQPYCAATIPAKLRKLFKKHADKAKE